MTIKDLKELLSHYDENVNVLFWTMDGGYYEYQFIDTDPMYTDNNNRIDICLDKKESEW